MSSSRRSSADVNILAMLDGLGTRPRGRRTMLWCGVGGVLACTLVGTLTWMVHDASPAPPPAIVVELPAPAQLAAQAAPPAPAAPDPEPAALPAPSGGATIVNLPVVSGADTKPALAAVPPAEPPPAVPAPKHASAPAQKAPSTRQPAARTSVASVHGAVHPAAKRHAAAKSAAPAPAAVDTDVALISAIIQHTGAEDGGCGDKPCGPRMPARP